MKTYILFIIAMLFLSVELEAQSKLSLNDAIDMSIRNNYGIKIAENNRTIAGNNKTKGNAGYLPTIVIDGNTQFAENSSEQNSTNASIGLGLDYTLYDGNRRKNNFDLLTFQFNQADIQLRSEIEELIIQVVDIYLSASLSYEQIFVLQNTLNISKSRLERKVAENEMGSSNKIDVLNARVDYNKDSILYMNINYQYKMQKMKLVELIKTKWVSPDFEVNSQTEVAQVFDLNILIADAKNNNTQIVLGQNSIEQFKLHEKIAKGGFLPSLSMNTGYNFNSMNPVIYNPRSNNSQLPVGISFRMPIFNGGQTKTSITNAKLNLKNKELYQAQNFLILENQVRLTYELFLNQIENLKLETQNLETSSTNLEISVELLRNGQITNIQFREAQLNQRQSNANLLRAKYEVKRSEFNLLLITGQILPYFNL